MADAGVELAAPAPRVEAVLLSSPPFLTLLSTSLDAGLLSIIKRALLEHRVDYVLCG